MWDLMNTGADLRQYVLQTHNSKNYEDSMGGGLNSRNPPPSGYASGQFYLYQLAQFFDGHRCLRSSLTSRSFFMFVKQFLAHNYASPLTFLSLSRAVGGTANLT